MMRNSPRGWNREVSALSVMRTRSTSLAVHTANG
jgi:hypothetical protein